MALLPGDEEIRTIYKFRCLSPYTFENLEKGQVRFTQPTKFNDPFDCMSNTELRGGEAEWVKYITSISDDDDKTEKILTYLRSKNYNADEYSIKNKQIDELYVLSLTENSENILMWSHYAEYHKCICLGFETAIESDSLGLYFEEDDISYTLPGVTPGFLPMYRVEYEENMPVPYNRLTERTERIMEFVFRKHTDWAYEKERRVVGTKNVINTQNVKYRKSILKEVIFGYKASADTIECVDSILKAKYPDHGRHIRRRIAVPIEGKYAVRIVDL